MILLSTFYSSDEMRTSMVYLDNGQYQVVTLDSYANKERTLTFETRQLAEDFAEDFVL